jgi:hypothetical protein
MKIIELTNNILLPVTNEESDLLTQFESKDLVDKNEMTEREQVLASNLVNKGILERRRLDGKVNYRKSSNYRKIS